MNLTLSRASEAFEISSLIKTSFLVYRELMMISISLATSALKENSSLDYYDELNLKIFFTSISDCTS
jgi:hypothetical protein